MKIKMIKTNKDYGQSLIRLELICDAKKGTEEGDELEELSVLIENYENENFPSVYPIRQIHEKMNIPTEVLIQAY